MTLPLGVWAVGCALALVALRRRLAPFFLSPVVLVAASMLALAVGGAVFYQDVAMAPGGAGIRLVISDQLVRETTQLLLLAVSAFLAGSAAGAVRRNSGPRTRVSFTAVTLPPATLTAVAVACAVPAVYACFVPGLPYLLDRPFYIENAYGGGVAAIGAQLSVAAVLGCGFLAVAWRGAGRVFVVVLFVVYLCLFFGQATRGMALAPTLFALGAFAAAPGRRTRIGLLVAAVLSVYLLRLPLFLRGQVHHGIIPYAGDLPSYFAATSGWDVVALNVLISFGIIGTTAYVQPHFPLHDLIVSINPLPGGWAGWYQIAAVHRLNVYSPYGAVGELGNVGPVAVIGYFFVLGLLMAFLDRRVRAHLLAGRQAPALVVIGLVGLFCLYNQQYNLRQSTRMVYYAVAVELAVMAFLWLRNRRRPEQDDVLGPAPADAPDAGDPLPVAAGRTD